MTEPKKPNRTPIVVAAAVVLLGIAGYLGWRVFHEQQQVPEAVVEKPLPVVDAGTPTLLPSLNAAEGDALLKNGAAGLSPEATLATWLAQPDIVRRLVAAVNQVAEGESPHETLGFMEVKGAFEVTEQKRKKKKDPRVFFMSPASTARYDGVTKVIGSVDAVAAGTLYGKVRPFAESVFREIAPPGKTLNDAVQKAIDNLAAVPLSDGPVELVPMVEGIGYAYADPKLEALNRAQKHLLRMGPANARVIIEKLTAFQAAAATSN